MHDHRDTNLGLIESTRRYCSLFKEWFCSLTFKQFIDLVKSRGSLSYHMEAIEISSSLGSEWDLSDLSDDEPEVASKPEVESKPEVTSTRVLPNWRPTPTANSRAEGIQTQHQKPPSGSGGGHSRANHCSHAESSAGASYAYGQQSNIDSDRPRILPHTLMRDKAVSSAPYASSSDPLQNIGFGEERVTGDERSIYQAALQDLRQPKKELDLPEGILTISLLRHQKIALDWMVQKESSVHCLGGILADDQGLGKTISTIALIQKLRNMQMRSQSEKHDIGEALDLDDDDHNKRTKKDDGHFKSRGSYINRPETINLDDDDDNEGTFTTAEKKLSNPKYTAGASSSDHRFSRKRPAAGTLIVCPATVLRQWARELKEKVSERGELSILIYHGGSRTKEPVELAKYDVVLTTYSIVTNEVPKEPIVDDDDGEQKLGERFGASFGFLNTNKRKRSSTSSKKGRKGWSLADDSFYSESGALAKVSWFRVVLDEAQTIKNHRTKTARACYGLKAKRRWCLSGTPIQNSIDELYSYFRFLRHHIYSDYKVFCETIKFPISRDPIIGYKKLQAILKTLLLRRTKDTLLDGEPIINLPPKIINMKAVNFTVEERAFYAQLEAEARSQFKAYAAAGTVSQNYANILLMILRLRQACDHPLLVKGFNAEPARKTSLEKAKKLPRQTLLQLLKRLESPSAICLICGDPAEDTVITTCGHVFCYQCVGDYLTGDDTVCPDQRCKEQLSEDVLFSEATLQSCLSSVRISNGSCPRSSSILSSEYSSSKIKAAMEILRSHCKLNSPCKELNGFGGRDGDGGPVKTLVFSQWTRMLDLLEYPLKQYHIKYRRLDGSMSLVARDKSVREFNSNPQVTVMLMSLKAGNLGLNMVAACHVILLDLWWNPTTEDQAIDRAHRIGQTRPVTVTRITIKDTVEDRILALQEEKRKMVASAFGEDHVGGSGARLTINDIKYLFLGNRPL